MELNAKGNADLILGNCCRIQTRGQIMSIYANLCQFMSIDANFWCCQSAVAPQLCKLNECIYFPPPPPHPPTPPTAPSIRRILEIA